MWESDSDPPWLVSKLLSPGCWELGFKSSSTPSVLAGVWQGHRSITVKQRMQTIPCIMDSYKVNSFNKWHHKTLWYFQNMLSSLLCSCWGNVKMFSHLDDVSHLHQLLLMCSLWCVQVFHVLHRGCVGVCPVISLEFIVVTMEIGYKSLLFFKKNLMFLWFLFILRKKFQKYCGWEYELLGK